MAVKPYNRLAVGAHKLG